MYSNLGGQKSQAPTFMFLSTFNQCLTGHFDIMCVCLVRCDDLFSIEVKLETVADAVFRKVFFVVLPFGIPILRGPPDCTARFKQRNKHCKVLPSQIASEKSDVKSDKEGTLSIFYARVTETRSPICTAKHCQLFFLVVGNFLR